MGRSWRYTLYLFISTYEGQFLDGEVLFIYVEFIVFVIFFVHLDLREGQHSLATGAQLTVQVL